MTKGTKNWNDPNSYYKQNNNGAEEALRKQLAFFSVKYKFAVKSATHFEFCGPTSAVNCMASIGTVKEILTSGGFSIQQEDALSMYFSTPSNYPLFTKIAPQFDYTVTNANRCPSLYPQAVMDVFGVKCTFINSLINFAKVKGYVMAGSSVQLALIDPGHFIAVVAYDDATNELIYNDSWDGRDGIKGFNRRMGVAEYSANIKPYALVYSV